MRTLKRVLVDVTFAVVLAGCEPAVSALGPCGPREDLIGGWRRSSDGATLRIELDGSFEHLRSGVAQRGRYQVSDTLIRLLVEQPAVAKIESGYCVAGGRLGIEALGEAYDQTD